MQSRYLNEKSIRILIFLGQLLVLIICIAYIRFQYHDKIRPDLLVPDTFIETPCVVLAEELTTAGYFFPQYRANFLIRYSVDDKQYMRWVSGNGLDLSVDRDRASQETLMKQFNKGDSTICWYNPAHPDIVVLVQRSNWLATLPLLIPSIIALIAIYYILGNLFQFISDLRNDEKTNSH